MPIVYTQSWEASRSDTLDSREFGTIITVVATAGEVLNPVNVTTATHATSGAPLPTLNSTSPLDTRYYVRSVSFPRFDGPRYATISVTYGLGKGSGKEEEEDPLNASLRYSVRNGVSTEATDADVDGNALLNSAGDPFAGTVQTNISALFIDVTRNESAFNLQQAIAFTNKVNSGQFSLAGYPINPGEAYCVGIQPATQYSLGDTFVEVVYSFELRERLTLANGGRVTAFIHRLLDQGKRGWATIPGGGGDSVRLDDIAVGGGENIDPSPVSSDVLLDGNGQPLEKTAFQGMEDNWEAWAAPPANKAPNAIRDVNPNTNATFLLYDKHFTANFAGLGLA